MAKQSEVIIEQVIREMQQGKTAPYLCRDDSGIQHIVKGKNATLAGLIREWVCAVLGTAFQLPIPDFAVAWVDEPFQRVKELFEYNFASQFVANIQDVNAATLSKLPQQLINDLYMFDYWVMNGDRTLTDKGGNPNFFIHQMTSKAYVIDHNLAFDDEFDLELHKTIHVCSQYKQWVGLFSIERERYTHLFETAITSLNQALAEIPEEWLDSYSLHRIQGEIFPILERYKEEQFWEDIQ